MNLRLRINMGFLLIVFVMAVVAGLIIYQQTKMQTAFQDSLQTCDLDKYLLECRRQEKNYILRDTEQDALTLFQANYDSLYSTTESLHDDIYDEAIFEKLSLLQEYLYNYYNTFMRIVQYGNGDLYINQIDVISNECVQLARECHSIIEDIRVLSNERFTQAMAISSMVNTFSVILGIFLSVIISSFIADKVMDLIGIPEDKLIKITKTKKQK